VRQITQSKDRRVTRYKKSAADTPPPWTTTIFNANWSVSLDRTQPRAGRGWRRWPRSERSNGFAAQPETYPVDDDGRFHPGGPEWWDLDRGDSDQVRERWRQALSR